jgi:lipid-A-disaccharide synthase
MRVFFSVGEPSGDVHGAYLIAELRRRDPAVVCDGFGGPLMAAAGCQLQADLTELAVMGIRRVVKHIGRFRSLLREAELRFVTHRPDVVVLIDYPGFNWWVARAARRLGIRVVYYVAPQLWAWAPWRIHKLRRLIDSVLCTLPFEQAWYEERGCRATYIGHPFFDDTDRRILDAHFLAQHAGAAPLITLLPGSRTQEVTVNLPVFIETARTISRQRPDVRFALACFNERHADYARQQLRHIHLPLSVHAGRTPELIHLAHSCLACSGSVSLELLAELKPSVIHYRVSPLALGVQRYFRRVKYITLVNLLAVPLIEARFPAELYNPDDPRAERVPFPEYLTCGDRSASMAAQLLNWLNNPDEHNQCRSWLHRLRDRHGSPGATARAAEAVLQFAGVPRRAANAA